MTRASRIRKVFGALLLGWMAGTLVSIPFNLFEVLRNTAGNWTLMVAAVGYGLALWIVWTLAISIVAGLVAAVPVALLVSPQILLRHRNLTLLVSAAAAALAVTVKFWGSWRLAAGELAAFLQYMLFTIALAVVTAAVYLRLLVPSEATEPVAG